MCRLTNTQEPTASVEIDDDNGAIHINTQQDTIRFKHDQPIGNPLLLPKPHEWTRLAFQNPNGVSVGRDGDLEVVLDHVKNMEVDVMFLPETQLDTTNTKVRSKVYNHCRRIFGQGNYQAVMAASPQEYAGFYKPGGVMGVTIGKTKGRIIETGTDQMGRWVYFTFSGKGNRVITMIGTYQVCQENARTAGPTTAIAQQYSLLVQEGRLNPHRVRDHHAKDLISFVKQHQAKGELVGVVGDFNDTIGEHNSGLTRLCSECNLQDAIFERHGHGCRDFNTHARGSTCIDYFLIDPDLMESVEACGYEPFNIRILGDHRGVYIDVDTNTFFGSDTIPLAPASTRDYCSKNIHQTAPFINEQAQHLEDHNWFSQIAELQRCIDTDTPNHALAEKLDKRRIEACLYSGKKLKRYGPVPYSPEVIKLKTIDKLLRCLISKRSAPEDDLETINMLRLKLDHLGVMVPNDLQELKNLQKANRKVQLATAKDEVKSRNQRRTFQDELAAEALAAGDKERARKIRQIQRAEAMKAVWTKCAVARGLNKGGGLSHVLVPTNPDEDPKQCEEWTKLDDPPEVVAAVTERLQKHFSQSKDCTWTSPPLDVTMDFEGCCRKAEEILTGEYDTTNLDETAKWIVDNLRYVVGSKEAITSELTSEELLGKLKAWDERTSTSPKTNVHLGHGKAYYAAHDLDPTSPEAEEFESNRNKIIRGHLTLLNYAIKFGYTYERWMNIVNALLEKDPGSPKIHRLRVIHLYEWDYNLLLCVKWRALLHHVVDAQSLNSACYGATPGKSSLDPVFIKELEYEIVRLTRYPLIHFDNDAASCYDRIPCFLANIASRKYGQSAKVCIVQGRTLKEAKYYLKTKFGLTDEYVQHTRECPWFGTGQGSGNSPMYWLLISSTLYDVHAQHARRGSIYHSPDKAIKIQIFQLGFVDDVNNRSNLPWDDIADDQDYLQELIDQASQESQLWHDILEAANQSLELTKCKYHVMHFEFKPSGKPEMVVESQPPAQLQVRDSNNNPVTITHVPSNEAVQYLGCQKAPVSQKQQKQALQKKCNDYGRVINCSQLTRKDTKCFYEGIYKPSVGYPLPMTYFTFEELAKIQAQAHQAMVTHCGFNRYTKRAVIYGPNHWGGAEFTHLYDIQGYGQVSYFIKSWRTPNSHQGVMIRIALQWAQFCAGTGRPILEDTITALPHLETEWLTSLRTYLKDVTGTIQVDHPGVPELMRERDQYIMDMVVRSGKFKPGEIKRINYCRLYLNVTTVSEITNANGNIIDPGMLEGNKDSINTSSRWQAVHQKRPDKTSWKLWKRVCKSISVKIHHRQYLVEPLGSWIVKPEQMRREWPFWHDPIQNLLYHKTNGEIHEHRRLLYDFDKDIHLVVDNIPAAAVPVDVTPQADTWRMNPHYNSWAIPQSPPQFQDLHTVIHHMDKWEKMLLQGLVLQVSQEEFLRLVSEPTLVASDGSVQGSRASFAWVMSTVDGNRFATCVGPALGLKPTSYRAEGYGILSLVRFLHLIKQQFNTQIDCHVVCDNEAMVKRTRSPNDVTKVYPNETLASDWDVLAEIWSTLHQNNLADSITVQHIKGHSDKHKPYQELTLLQQLNVDADSMADSYIQQHWDDEYHEVPLLPTSGAQLNLEQGTVTYKMKRELRLARTEGPLRDYLCEKNKWSRETFDSIDWEDHRRALNRLNKHRTILIKYLNGIAPVGKLVHEYDPKYPANCPSCQEPIETQDHLFVCMNSKRREWRSNMLSAIRKEMEDSDTPVDVMQLMLEGLKCVVEGRDKSTIAIPDSVVHIAEAQSAVGWDQLLKGRLASEWMKHQKEYLGERSTDRKNANTWATGIITTIFQQWLDLWKLRNGDRHGRDYKTQAEAAKQQAVREIEQLYEYKGQLLPQHEWILATPLEQQRSKRTYVLRAFISNFGPIIEESYKTRLETG